MSKSVLTAFLFFFCMAKAHSSALVDPILMSEASSGRQMQVIALLNVSTEGTAPAQRYNRGDVVRYYREVTRRAVMPLLEDAQNGKLPGVTIHRIFWINGSIRADLTPAGLENLRNHAAIKKIYKNRFLHLENVRRGNRCSPTSSYCATAQEYPDNLKTIGLDRVRREFPRLTGQGVVVGVEDSGVEASHPDLQGKVVSFFNAMRKEDKQPLDMDFAWSHGTHVCGIIAAGNTSSKLIGIAPGAKLAVAGAVVGATDEDVYDNEISGMQWFLDAEKNPLVAQKVKVINNSWQSDGAPDQELFYRVMAAWEAAGILPIFSSGNIMDGKTRNQTITPPHEYPGTFTVGNLQGDGTIHPGSSRGPAIYHGQPINKPELSAPGTDINSTVRNGEYAALTGTSMAAPHVAGVAALLGQIIPQINPQQIRTLLIQGATQGRGQEKGQWTPDYGYGVLNAYGSVQLAMKRQQFMGSGGYQIDPGALIQGPWEQMSQLAFDNASMGEVGAELWTYPAAELQEWATTQAL